MASKKTLKQRIDGTKKHAKYTANYGGVAVLVVATATHLIPGVDGALDNGLVPAANLAGDGIASALQAIGALLADVYATATAGFQK